MKEKRQSGLHIPAEDVLPAIVKHPRERPPLPSAELPWHTGLVTGAACEDLAQEHPRAGRSAGMEKKLSSPPARELHAAARRAD